MLKPNFSENTNKIGTKTSKADEKKERRKVEKNKVTQTSGTPLGYRVIKCPTVVR